MLAGGLQLDHLRGAVLEEARSAQKLPLPDVFQSVVACGRGLGGCGEGLGHLGLSEQTERPRYYAFVEVFDVAEERRNVEDLNEVGLVRQLRSSSLASGLILLCVLLLDRGARVNLALTPLACQFGALVHELLHQVDLGRLLLLSHVAYEDLALESNSLREVVILRGRLSTTRGRLA